MGLLKDMAEFVDAIDKSAWRKAIKKYEGGKNMIEPTVGRIVSISNIRRATLPTLTGPGVPWLASQTDMLCDDWKVLLEQIDEGRDQTNG